MPFDNSLQALRARDAAAARERRARAASAPPSKRAREFPEEDEDDAQDAADALHSLRLAGAQLGARARERDTRTTRSNHAIVHKLALASTRRTIYTRASARHSCLHSPAQLGCSVWRGSTELHVAILLCRRYARADSGRAMHAAAARERRACCASAPETELFSPSYFLLHGTIQLSTYSVTGWTAQCIYGASPTAASALSSCLCIYSRGTPIPSQRESESVTGRLRFRHSASQSPSQAGLLCCHCIYGASPTGCSQLRSVYVRSEALRFRHSASQSPSRAGLLCCHLPAR